MALSGVRSSCDSVARNSSFRRLARSASSRAARSAISTSRSSYWRSRARSAARSVLTSAASAHRTIEQRDVAQELERLQRAQRRARLLPAGEEQHRHVGPGRLLLERPRQQAQTRTVEHFLGQDDGPGAALELVAQVGDVGADVARQIRPASSTSCVSAASRPTGACTSVRRSIRSRSAHRSSAGPPAPTYCGTPVSTPWKSVSASPTRSPSRLMRNSRIVGLVLAGPLLHDRDRPAHVALRLEEPQHDDRVGEVADVDRRRHRRADHAVLRHDQDRRDAALRQVREQLVHPDQRRIALRDRVR